MSKEHPPQTLHKPVLLEAVIDHVKPKLGESYLDLTAGYGGHANAFLNITRNFKDSYLVDRDDLAVSSLVPLSRKGVNLIHSDFLTASKQLIEEGKKFDIVMIDLGVSSPQLDQSERGFSFTNNGQLDMRMDRRQALSAQDLLNNSVEPELVSIIHDYGDEPLSSARKIAKTIIDNRPLTQTQQLADLVKQNYKGRWSKIHPATRTFQAIRIAVNDELSQISNLLPLLPDLLRPGGRLAIISFHSLEDRLVKAYLKDQMSSGLEAKLELVTKKAIKGNIEDVYNPRSRSAKLRIADKK